MKRFITLCIILLTFPVSRAADIDVASPNGRLEAHLTMRGELTLSITLDGDAILLPSAIGLSLTDGTEVGPGMKAKAAKTLLKSEHIDAVAYRQKSFHAKWTQTDVSLGKGFRLELRVYDEGVAYRFTTSRKGETKIKSETANLDFGRDRMSWLAYTTTPGNPFAMAFQNTYTVGKLDTAHTGHVFLPATVDCVKAKVTILESDVANYPNMWLTPENGRLKAANAPYPAKMEYHPWRRMTYVASPENYIAKSTGARTYPWRILAVSQSDTQMPTNNMVYALARPNKVKDTDWIKPGKAAWEWWNDWNIKGVDFEAGINFETYKYYIDFAAAHGLEYIVLDEGWYDSNAGTIMQPTEELNFNDLLSYAQSKGVGLFLWAVFNVMDEDLENICSHYSRLGVKGFKVDFMDRDDQTAVEMVERLAECTARHHLLLDLHGIYKPVGLERTYPNIINYESVFGMEECRWTDMGHDMPLYDVTFPYIRLMAGPVDFTPGAMRNGTRRDWKAVYTKPISMGTRCHQAACYIVHDSPFTMLADSPTNYEADETYTRFIATTPSVFDETIVPQGRLGEYIVTARRCGDDWFVGGQTNWDGRDISLQLSFLEEGVTYEAQIMHDGKNAQRDAEDYAIDTITVNKESDLNIRMASGGGFVIKVIKK